MTSVETNDGEATTSVAMKELEGTAPEQQGRDNRAFTHHSDNGQIGTTNSNIQRASKTSLPYYLPRYNLSLVPVHSHKLLEIKVFLFCFFAHNIKGLLKFFEDCS